MGMGEGAKALHNMLNNLGSALLHINSDNKLLHMFGIVIKLFILYIKAIVMSVCGDKQGIGRATDTHPLPTHCTC
jgi:hypothetical protein